MSHPLASMPKHAWLAALLLLACDGAEEPSDAGLDGATSAPDAGTDAGLPPDPVYALAEPVEVFRDPTGMVHLYAQSDEDLFFASGYQQAADRLLSMELTRRRALGRRAELLGERYVDDDALVRIVQLPRWGREAEAQLRAEQPESYALIVAWVSGVNARIAEIARGEAPLPYGFGPDELDYEPEPWRVSDAFTVGKLILWGNANQLEFDLLATIIREVLPATFASIPLMSPMVDAPILPEDERPTGGRTMSWEPGAAPPAPALPPDLAARVRRVLQLVPEPTARFSSNNWAVDGRHTESGRPLIAGDPHQPLRSPSVFYLQHLNSADAGGAFDVAGFSFVGTPAVQLGHNRHVAWTATTTYPDISDLWEVRAAGDTVNVGGESRTVTRRTETIPVRDGEAVTVTVEEVPGYGVLLPDDLAPIPVTGAGRRLLYNWVGFRPTQEAYSFLQLDRAETLEDFEAAVDGMEIGCFNFIGATADGISYRSSPLVPLRAPDVRDAWTMQDGDDPNTFWRDGFLELLPRSRGGARGWLASANNDPYGFTSGGSLEDDPFYFGVFYDPGTRGARIEAELTRLTAGGAVTPAVMEALQMDSHSVVADLLLPVLQESWEAVPTDDALAEFRDRPELATLVTLLLDDWNRRLDRDQAGAVAFDVFTFMVTRRAIEDELSVLYDTILGEEPIYVVKWAVNTLRRTFPGAEDLLEGGRDHVVMTALSDTASWLERRFGGVDPSLYTWGDHHGTRLLTDYGEARDGGWVATDGGLGTVNKSPARFPEGEDGLAPLESTSGPVYRMVAGFAEDGTPEARFTHVRGNVGDPTDPGFAANTEDWVEGRYTPLRFARGAIEADATESWRLEP